MIKPLGKKPWIAFFIFLLFLVWQASAFSLDSTELGRSNLTPTPPHPYIIKYGSQQIKTSNGGTIASTTRTCMPDYQLQYMVSIASTQNNYGILEISNIWLETCLSANKNIQANKRANVNYFGPFTGTGMITVNYWYVCKPCKHCPPVAVSC